MGCVCVVGGQVANLEAARSQCIFRSALWITERPSRRWTGIHLSLESMCCRRGLRDLGAYRNLGRTERGNARSALPPEIRFDCDVRPSFVLASLPSTTTIETISQSYRTVQVPRPSASTHGSRTCRPSMYCRPCHPAQLIRDGRSGVIWALVWVSTRRHRIEELGGSLVYWYGHGNLSFALSFGSSRI
jgi:hypothetical protein